MFKISEFSRLVRVSPRMLRHYEACGLFYPYTIDEDTGYRYYSSTQIQTVIKITTLRDLGFSVQEIMDILPVFDDTDKMNAVITSKHREIEAIISAEHAKLNRLDALNLYLQKEHTYMIYDVEVKALPAVNVISHQAIIPHYNQEGMLWEKLGTYIGMNQVPCLSGSYSLYLDHEYKEKDARVEIAIEVESLGESDGEIVFKTYDAIPEAATIRFSGVFDGGFDAAHAKLAEWMEQNGFTFAGYTRSQNIVSPADDPNPENWLTELQIPIKKQQ